MKKAIIGSLILVFGGLGLWFFGRPAYRQYRERRAIEQARHSLAKGDYRNASLGARQTLQVNPLNLDLADFQPALKNRPHLSRNYG